MNKTASKKTKLEISKEKDALVQKTSGVKVSSPKITIKSNETKMPACDFLFVHQDTLKRVYKNLPDDETLFNLSELYKVFGDSTRIKILYVLLESEMCVCDIAKILNTTSSAVSHQLRILKQFGLIAYRKSGKSVFYSLADNHVRTIINQGIEHITEEDE